MHALSLEQVTDEDFANVSHMSELRFLGVFVDPDLGGSGRISDAALEHISGLTQLRHIEFIRAAIEGSGLVHFRQLTQLRILKLRRGSLSEGLEHLSALSNLEDLDLSFSEPDDEDVSHLRTLQSLEQINLAGTLITDASTPSIGELTELRRLRLSSNNITDAGLPPLIRLPNLEHIHLGLTLVTDFGEMMFRDGIEVLR